MIKIISTRLTVGFIIFFQISFGQQSVDDFLWGDDIYITTASKKQEVSNSAPATVIVITEKMIRERGYRDLKDVLNDIPGFDLSTNVYGEFSTLVTQRGVGGNNKIVVLLNGVNITSPSGKQFQFGNNIPVWNLDKIEIVFGPASTLYGANAFSVINMITHDPKVGDENEMNIMVSEHHTNDLYLSFGKEFSNDISIDGFFRSYTSEGSDLLNEYDEYSDEFNGFKFGYNDPIEDRNLFLRLNLGSLSFQLHHSQVKEQLSKGLNPDSHYMYSKDAWWGNTLWHLNTSHIYENEAVSIVSNMGYRHYEITPEMNWAYYSAWTDDNQLLVHQYGSTGQVEFESILDYDYSLKLNIMVGLEYSRSMGLPIGDKNGDPFDRNAHLLLDNFYNNTNGFVQAAIQENEKAIFFQTTYYFNDYLKILGGLRHNTNSSYGTSLNPRGGLIYTKRNTIIKLLYGTAYIAPSSFHRYETWFATEYGHLQNPDLKPETMETVELNLVKNISDKAKVSISLFQNNVDDLIVRKTYGTIDFPTEWVEAGAGWVDADTNGTILMEWSTNFGQLKSHGIDMTFNYVFNQKINFFLGYSYLDGTNTDPETGEDLELFKTSNHKFMGGLTAKWHHVSFTPRFRWVSDIATRRENELFGVDRDGDWIPESSHEKMPGYFLTNLSMDYHLPRGISLYLHIDNALNNHYYTSGVATEGSHTYLPRVPQKLRHISFGLSWQY